MDQAGAGLDILGQRRRHKAAAKQLFRTRLQGVRDVPRLIITDHLNRDGAATRELLPGWTIAAPRSQPPRGELASADAPTGAAPAGV